MNADPASQDQIDGLESLAILENLRVEIRRPLELLQREIESLLAEPQVPLTEAERDQAAIMLVLCGEIRQLTGDSREASSQGER